MDILPRNPANRSTLVIKESIPGKKILKQADAESYELLLRKIGNGFGFTNNETNLLIKEITELGEETGNNPIDLTRQFLKKCIIKLSSRFFNERNPASSTFISNRIQYQQSFKLSSMPLSNRAVYILFHIAGQSEHEIARILNINVFQVKERLLRAVMIMKRN